MTDAVFSSGISASNILTAALAQPVGTQKSKYSADVVTLLGPNPIFEIMVGSTVVYHSTVSSALAYSAAGIALPARFTEPPLINIANALTSGSIVLRNANNSDVSVTVPLRVGGGTEYLTASVALNGVAAVATSGLLLVPPPSLDVPVAGGGFWDTARVNEAIATSAGANNEMPISGVTSPPNNWLSHATISFGSRWNDAQPGNWGWPFGNWGPNSSYFMTWFEPWGFLFSEQGSSILGEIEMRNWDFQVKDRDTGAWRRPFGSKVSMMNWAEYYTVSPTGSVAQTGQSCPNRPGLDGGWSIALGTGTQAHAHFGFIPLHFVERVQVGGVKNFDAVMVSCEFRADPRNPPGFSGGLHVGGDPKPTGTGDQMGMPYYIAFANSCVRRATADWRTVTATNINPSNEAMNDRRTSAADFAANPPML